MIAKSVIQIDDILGIAFTGDRDQSARFVVEPQLQYRIFEFAPELECVPVAAQRRRI
jgi:hypothetical protein